MLRLHQIEKERGIRSKEAKRRGQVHRLPSRKVELRTHRFVPWFYRMPTALATFTVKVFLRILLLNEDHETGCQTMTDRPVVKGCLVA